MFRPLVLIPLALCLLVGCAPVEFPPMPDAAPEVALPPQDTVSEPDSPSPPDAQAVRDTTPELPPQNPPADAEPADHPLGPDAAYHPDAPSDASAEVGGGSDTPDAPPDASPDVAAMPEARVPDASPEAPSPCGLDGAPCCWGSVLCSAGYACRGTPSSSVCGCGHRGEPCCPGFRCSSGSCRTVGSRRECG